MPAIDERDGRVHPSSIGKPVEELILWPEELGRPDDCSPGEGLFDSLLSLKLRTRPFRFRFGVSGERRDVNEIVHLHLRAQLGDGSRYVDIALFECEVRLHVDVGKRLLRGRSLSLIVLANHVDDNVSISNNFSHRIAVARRVVGETTTAEVEIGLQVAHFKLISSVGYVSQGTIRAEFAADVSSEESTGTKDGDLDTSHGRPTSRSRLPGAPLGNLGGVKLYATRSICCERSG
mmetsp:Transcript_29805/g.88471  ORF Transcript_29805/g.88471 Transcript_29805/m.88471 type:complete len:234 (+) Transcript_29805:577-1278(+)